MKSKTGIILFKTCRGKKESSSSPLLSLSKQNVKLIPKAHSSTNGSGSGVKPAVQHTSLTALSATGVHCHQLVSERNARAALFFLSKQMFPAAITLHLFSQSFLLLPPQTQAWDSSPPLQPRICNFLSIRDFSCKLTFQWNLYNHVALPPPPPTNYEKKGWNPLWQNICQRVFK